MKDRGDTHQLGYGTHYQMITTVSTYESFKNRNRKLDLSRL